MHPCVQILVPYEVFSSAIYLVRASLAIREDWGLDSFNTILLLLFASGSITELNIQQTGFLRRNTITDF